MHFSYPSHALEKKKNGQRIPLKVLTKMVNDLQLVESVAVHQNERKVSLCTQYMLLVLFKQRTVESGDTVFTL